MTAFALAALVAALGASPALAVEVVPIGRISALGGQIFFGAPDGRNTSWAGTGDWLFAPAIAIGEGNTIVPSVSGQYLNRTQVSQLGGGGRLTTQTLDTVTSLRWVKSIGSWAMKPNLSYKNELITTSAGERLGAGLFDYHKFGAGLDAEWKGGGFKSVRQSLTIYRAHFYHYQARRSPLSGIELISHDRALDFYQYGYSIAAERDAWAGGALNASAQISIRDFRKQRIVEESAITDRTRKDLFTAVIAGVSQNLAEDNPLFAPIGSHASIGMNAGYVNVSSNQNDFDPARFKFTPGFYSYRELTAGPWITLRWRNGASATFTYGYGRRQYPHRLLQTPNGVYTTDKIHSDNHTVSYSVLYPLGRGLSIAASGGYASLSSNMRYEAAYRYNYAYAYHFTGLTYSY